MVLSWDLIHSRVLFLSQQMVHSGDVVLSPRMVHSADLVLSEVLIHSIRVVLSRGMIHFQFIVPSCLLIKTEHPFYAHAQREQIHKVQGRDVGSGACTMLREDG